MTRRPAFGASPAAWSIRRPFRGRYLAESFIRIDAFSHPEPLQSGKYGMNAVFPDRERLQRRVVLWCARTMPGRTPAWSEGVGQLRDGKNPFVVELFPVLLAYVG